MAESNSNTSDFHLPENWDDIESVTTDIPEVDQIPSVEVGPPAYYNDPVFYRIVGGTLCLVVVASMIGMFFLAGNSIKIPEGIIAVASTAVGALAGVLAGSRR